MLLHNFGWIDIWLRLIFDTTPRGPLPAKEVGSMLVVME
jgi:hypothetical protein